MMFLIAERLLKCGWRVSISMKINIDGLCTLFASIILFVVSLLTIFLVFTKCSGIILIVLIPFCLWLFILNIIAIRTAIKI